MSGYFIDTPKLIGWCFDHILKAIEFYNEGGSVQDDAGNIIKAINYNDVEAAESLIKKYKINLV